jgi:hypothetical protein
MNNFSGDKMAWVWGTENTTTPFSPLAMGEGKQSASHPCRFTRLPPKRFFSMKIEKLIQGTSQLSYYTMLEF